MILLLKDFSPKYKQIKHKHETVSVMWSLNSCTPEGPVHFENNPDGQKL